VDNPRPQLSSYLDQLYDKADEDRKRMKEDPLYRRFVEACERIHDEEKRVSLARRIAAVGGLEVVLETLPPPGPDPEDRKVDA